MSPNPDTVLIEDAYGQERISRDCIVEAPNPAIALRKDSIVKPRRGKKKHIDRQKADDSPKNIVDTPSESVAKSIEDVQAEVPSEQVQSAESTRDGLVDPCQEIVEIDNIVEGCTFVRVIPVTTEKIAEFRSHKARAGTLRLDNIATEGITLVQVFGLDYSSIPLSSDSLEECAPHIVTCLQRPSNGKISFEISDERMQRKDFEEGHVFD